MSQMTPERRTSEARDWEQPRDLDQIPERIRRMLDQTFGRLGWSVPLPAEALAWIPAVDIEEQDDAFVVEAELPGVRREDVNIEVVGNELTVSGEIKERERVGILRRRERRIGRFEYRVLLPDRVDSEHIDANLRDGVLAIRIPKAERAQRRQIEITE
jgi:HSP20 family protein